MSSSAPPSHAQMRAQMVHASERATLPLQLAPAQREPLPARRGPSPTRRRVHHAARAAEAVVAFQSGGGHDHAAHATAAHHKPPRPQASSRGDSWRAVLRQQTEELRQHEDAASVSSLASRASISSSVASRSVARITLRPAGSTWAGVAVSKPGSFRSLQRRGLRMLHLFSQRGGVSAEALHGVSPGDVVVELEDGANGVVGEIVDVADLAHGDVLSVSLSRVGVATPPARVPEDESPGTQRKRARATRKSAARQQQEQEQQEQLQQQQRPPEPVQQAAPAEGVPPPSRAQPAARVAQADDDVELEVQQRVIIRYAALFLESTLFLVNSGQRQVAAVVAQQLQDYLTPPVHDPQLLQLRSLIPAEAAAYDRLSRRHGFQGAALGAAISGLLPTAHGNLASLDAGRGRGPIDPSLFIDRLFGRLFQLTAVEQFTGAGSKSDATKPRPKARAQRRATVPEGAAPLPVASQPEPKPQPQH